VKETADCLASSGGKKLFRAVARGRKEGEATHCPGKAGGGRCWRLEKEIESVFQKKERKKEGKLCGRSRRKRRSSERRDYASAREGEEAVSRPSGKLYGKGEERRKESLPSCPLPKRCHVEEAEET